MPPPRKVFPPGHASRKGPGDTEALPARLEQLRVQDEGVSKPVAKETTESAAPLRITISHGESSMAAAEEEGRSVRVCVCGCVCACEGLSSSLCFETQRQVSDTSLYILFSHHMPWRCCHGDCIMVVVMVTAEYSLSSPTLRAGCDLLHVLFV